jgi:hypothetical protein
MATAGVVMLLVAMCIIAGLITVAVAQRLRIRTLKQALRRYKQMYPRIIGNVEGFGDCDLVSLDGGHRWYGFSQVGEVIDIIGPAEKVYPRWILAQIFGFDGLPLRGRPAKKPDEPPPIVATAATSGS